MLKKLLFVLIAGGFGGLTSGVLVWFLGNTGITPLLGFNMVPDFSIGWISRRVLASVAWGVIFLIPIYRYAPLTKGAVLGILPWLSSILWVLPRVKGAGFLGMDLGIGTPVWTLFFGAFWGVSGMWLLVKLRQLP
jgi:hypothetical protein